MAPKLSKSKLERAQQAGGKVTTRPELPKPEPKAAPAPAPVKAPQSVDNDKVTDILAAQQRAQEQQGAQIERLASLISEMVGPVRLKAHRVMDPKDPRYLLIDYLDVVPVEIKRKLNS